MTRHRAENRNHGAYIPRYAVVPAPTKASSAPAMRGRFLLSMLSPPFAWDVRSEAGRHARQVRFPSSYGFLARSPGIRYAQRCNLTAGSEWRNSFKKNNSLPSVKGQICTSAERRNLNQLRIACYTFL